MARLSDKFQKAIRSAAESRELGQRFMCSLSIIVEGPPMSGKTYIVQQHIDALAEHALIDKNKVVRLDYQDLRQLRAGREEKEIDKTFAGAKGGVIVIDDILPLHPLENQKMQAYLGRKMIEAISAGDCIVILAGSEEGMTPFRRNGPLMSRMCEIITITKEPDIALAHPTKALQPFRLMKPALPGK